MPPGTQWLRKHKFADPGHRHRSRAAIHLPRHVMRALLAICLAALSACGLAYYSPRLTAVDSDAGKIRVIAITPQSLMAANLQPYTPRALPAVFSANAGTGAIRATGVLPQPVLAEPAGLMAPDMRLPPPFEPGPYIIGIGDVVLLATPDIGTSPGGFAGLLAAPDRRQGYTVQGDGAIAIPDAGRVQIAGSSVADAEARIFHHLVENQIEPAFSLEIAEFNSARISVGGAVQTPGVTPTVFTHLFLVGNLTAI